MTTIDLYYHIRLTHIISSFSHILQVHRHTDAYSLLSGLLYHGANSISARPVTLWSRDHRPTSVSQASMTRTSSPCFGNIPWYFGYIPRDGYLEIGLCPGTPQFPIIGYWILRHSYIQLPYIRNSPHSSAYERCVCRFFCWLAFSSLRLIPVWSWYMCYHMVPLLTCCLENLENPSTLPIPACTNENKREQ